MLDAPDDATRVRNLDHVPPHLPHSDHISPVPYTVSVSTANDKWAFTDSDVYIQIVGDIQSTPFIHLKEDEHRVKSTLRYAKPADVNSNNPPVVHFPIGSIREFHFVAPFVGNLRSICVRHDPNSRSAAWKPDRFVVHNEDLQRSWSFLCARWLNHDNANQVQLQPTGDVSAGRRASRRASRRLSLGKPDKHSPTSHSPAEHFATMRNRFRGNLSQTANTAMSNAVEAGTRRVCFQLQKFTQRACHVYLLGGIPALGEWQPERAIRMDMHSAADGTWRGEWRLELEIDDDFQVVQYTYMIINDTDSDKRRVECPDNVRDLNLSSPELLERIAEGGRIYVNDIFGNSKFASPSNATPSSAFRRRMSHRNSIETPLGAGRLVSGQLPVTRSPFVLASSTVDNNVQRNLNNSLAETQVSNRLTPSPQPPPEDTISRDTNPASETSNIEASSASESREFDSDSRMAWQDQLDVADGQIFRTSKRILRRESEVISLRQRNSLEISTSPGLLSPDHAEPEKTSPVSSDSAPADDQEEPFGPSADDDDSFAGSVAADSSPVNHADLAKLTKPFIEERDQMKAEVDRLNVEIEDKCRANALECHDFKRELIELRKCMVEQCEVVEAQQAELVRLVMDNREASNTTIKELEEKSTMYLQRWKREFKARRKLFNTIQELRGNIRVFCRVRPLKTPVNPNGDAAKIAVDFPDAAAGDNAAIRSCSKLFEFDRVFSPTSSQKEVYEETSGVVASVFDGYNVCVFAYGQTGSGKTHTMNGPESDRGVNFRALVDLFDIAAERSEYCDVSIYLSMMEIYNENIHDLIRTGSAPAPKLEVRKDPDSSSPNAVYVPNLTEIKVGGVEAVWDVMEQGSRNRKNGKTNMNEHSSRSHLILKIKIMSQDIESGVKKAGVLYLVDLAGSERVNRSNVSGERLKEAQHINKSLATLGDVFMSLLSKASHIPYRNSRLTYLLQDSLGGDSKTLMFVNVSADDSDSSETLSSLQFAQRVAKVELGSAKKHTERSGDSRNAAALQLKEAELHGIQTKLSSCQRELKKRETEKDEDKTRIKTLESELRTAKRAVDDKSRRDSLGREASVRESRAAEEKRQTEIRAANQRTKEISTTKDNEIKRLQSLLQMRDKKITELSRNIGKGVENESAVAGSPGRAQRPSSAPSMMGRKAERTPLRSRPASTFAGRTRQVRFDKSVTTDESSGKSTSTESSKPTGTPRRPAEPKAALPRSQTIHSSRPQRQAAASNTPGPGKRIVYAFGSRVEVDKSDSSSGTSKPVRQTARLSRPPISTTFRPPRRAGQAAENRAGQPSSAAQRPTDGLGRANVLPNASRAGTS